MSYFSTIRLTYIYVHAKSIPVSILCKAQKKCTETGEKNTALKYCREHDW